MLKAKKRITPRMTKKQLKEDKFILKLFEILDYIQINKMQFLIAAGAAALLIFLGFYYTHEQEQAEAVASIRLAEAKGEFENGKYDAAVEILQGLVTSFDGTKSAGQALIVLGKSYMAKEMYEEQEQVFRRYLNDYGENSTLAVAAANGIAASYDQRGMYDRAAELYEQAASEYPQSFKAPELLLSAARCYQLAERPRDAQRVLQKITDEHETHVLAPEAKQFLAELQQ